jgi:ATP-binding protein involved in chromosome partitioning
VPANPVAEEAVRNVLLGVIDPELGDNIVDLGMVQVIEIGPQNGDVNVTIALTTAGCPLRAQIMKDIKLRVASLPGVPAAPVHFGEMSAEQKKNVMARARWKARDNALDTDIPATTRIVAIASGKGGVGKSSVTANLAAQLAQRGLTVGVLDADIGGFSIPRMLGVEGRVQGVTDESGRARFGPLEKPVGPGLLKVVSMGSIEGTGRGPGHHVARVHAQPGRAALPRRRGLGRHALPADRPAPGHRRHPDGPGPHAAPHRGGDRHHPGAGRPAGCRSGGRHGPQGLPAGSRGRREHERSVAPDGTRYAVFGSGGGEQLAEQLGVPLLGSIPLDPTVAAGGDAGEPAAIAAPHTPAAQAFAALTECIVTEAIPLVEMVTCTARQFFKAAGLLTPMPEPSPMATT